MVVELHRLLALYLDFTFRNTIRLGVSGRVNQVCGFQFVELLKLKDRGLSANNVVSVKVGLVLALFVVDLVDHA